METRDWKDSFFQVIPQRKRFEADSEEKQGDLVDDKDEQQYDVQEKKKPCTETWMAHGYSTKSMSISYHHILMWGSWNLV